MQNTDDLKFNFGCASCGYKESDERVNVAQVIEKLDSYFNRDDMPGAGRLLEYWRAEAVRLGDKSGELSIVSEQMGYYRKISEPVKGMESVDRGLALISELGLERHLSSGTIFLNAATTMKSFGKAEDALPLYERAKEIYTENLDRNDPRFAGFYNNYALALADVKRFKEAEAAYKTAIEIMEQAENGKPDAAISYINLAQLYGMDESKSGEDILTCMDRALALLRDPAHARDGYYYYVLSKCAPAFRETGYDEIAEDFDKATRAFYERA